MSHTETEPFPRSFWNAQNVPAIPLLQQLNDWVIQQNEKRLPKWKFRFAADFAIQIQSKLTRRYAVLFEGSALHAENVTAGFFAKLPDHGLYHSKVSFKLFANEGDAAWTFKPCSARYGDRRIDGLLETRDRILEVLHPDRFSKLSPDLMLKPCCLCCGKGLTDPASMARWIGPECWGSASTNLPNLFKLEQPTRREFPGGEARP
jgi:hypothetical protein